MIIIIVFQTFYKVKKKEITSKSKPLLEQHICLRTDKEPIEQF